MKAAMSVFALLMIIAGCSGESDKQKSRRNRLPVRRGRNLQEKRCPTLSKEHGAALSMRKGLECLSNSS